MDQTVELKFVPLGDGNNIYIMEFGALNSENRFNVKFIKNINSVLDAVEADLVGKTTGALVTIAKGKFFSNGLDLSSIASSAKEGTNVFDAIAVFLNGHYHPLLVRMLKLPIPTVCAINGHAYAGGLTFALAHDLRIMHENKGFLCMNELVLPSTIPDGMLGVLKAKINHATSLRDICLNAKRLTPVDAMKLGIVDEMITTSNNSEHLLENAIKLARLWAAPIKDLTFYGMIKVSLYCEAISELKKQISVTPANKL